MLRQGLDLVTHDLAMSVVLRLLKNVEKDTYSFIEVRNLNGQPQDLRLCGGDGKFDRNLVLCFAYAALHLLVLCLIFCEALKAEGVLAAGQYTHADASQLLKGRQTYGAVFLRQRMTEFFLGPLGLCGHAVWKEPAYIHALMLLRCEYILIAL